MLGNDRVEQGLLVAVFLGILVAVSGCFGGGSIQRDTAPTAQLPVPVMPEPHEELKECGKEEPTFRFYEHDEKEDHVVLPPQEQKQLQEWVDGKQRCLDGWREWSRG